MGSGRRLPIGNRVVTVEAEFWYSLGYNITYTLCIYLVVRIRILRSTYLEVRSIVRVQVPFWVQRIALPPQPVASCIMSAAAALILLLLPACLLLLLLQLLLQLLLLLLLLRVAADASVDHALACRALYCRQLIVGVGIIWNIYLSLIHI